MSKPVIFVVGTTASGKSEWALKLAQEFHGVIVNCDSVQVYKHLDIGAAKPTVQERKLVPHYLFDYVLPPQEMTAGVYSRDFHECLQKLADDAPVFVVGGTGFYFMAVEKGMYPVTTIPAHIQAEVASEIAQPGGPEKLHRELLAVDPEYGAKIHVTDPYRIGRAIELIRTQGKSVTQIQKEFSAKQTPFPYPLLKVGPTWDREKLRSRIEQRTQKMLQLGLVEEVRGLLDQGLESWAPMSSVGYKETQKYLSGQLDRDTLFAEIVKNTYQLAKRQRTWFQRDQDIHWCDGENGFEQVRVLVEKFLKP
jgi:tRNA dimethylallyltransferase